MSMYWFFSILMVLFQPLGRGLDYRIFWRFFLKYYMLCEISVGQQKDSDKGLRESSWNTVAVKFQIWASLQAVKITYLLSLWTSLSLSPAPPHPLNSLSFSCLLMRNRSTYLGLRLWKRCHGDAAHQTTRCHCAPQKCTRRASPATAAKGQPLWAELRAANPRHGMNRPQDALSWGRRKSTCMCHFGVTQAFLSPPVPPPRAFVLTVIVSGKAAPKLALEGRVVGPVQVPSGGWDEEETASGKAEPVEYCTSDVNTATLLGPLGAHHSYCGQWF